jgi:hypothetical protein
MVKNNGARGAVTFLSWVLVAVAVALFVGWVYTVFFK